MIKYTLKNKQQMHFHTEEELQNYLKENPQLRISQRFGHGTEMINVSFEEFGFARGIINDGGYFIATTWLTEAEVQEARERGEISSRELGIEKWHLGRGNNI